MNIKRQLRRVNAFGFFACLNITDAVWVVLLAARGFPLWQIGMAEAIFHVVSLVFEIPSGMAADLMGRRRSMAAAGLCSAAASLFMAFGQGFFSVCMCMALAALGGNFISGSDEALMYDSLIQCGQEEEYIERSARYTQWQNLGATLSNFASFLTAFMGYVGFYLVDAALSLGRFFCALGLEEPTVTKAQKERTAAPFAQLGLRFREHRRQVAEFLRESPALVRLMLADGLINLPCYLTLMFLQKRLEELGLHTMWLGLPIMCVSLSRAAGVAIGEKLRPGRLRRLYVLCALIVAAGTITAGSAAIAAAIPGAMLAAAAMDAWTLHLHRHLNEHFPSDRRASLVSVNAMAYSLLMIPASPIVGALGDLGYGAGLGLCALGLTVALGAAAAAFKR